MSICLRYCRGYALSSVMPCSCTYLSASSGATPKHPLWSGGSVSPSNISPAHRSKSFKSRLHAFSWWLTRAAEVIAQQHSANMHELLLSGKNVIFSLNRCFTQRILTAPLLFHWDFQAWMASQAEVGKKVRPLPVLIFSTSCHCWKVKTKHQGISTDIFFFHKKQTKENHMNTIRFL